MREHVYDKYTCLYFDKGDILHYYTVLTCTLHKINSVGTNIVVIILVFSLDLSVSLVKFLLMVVVRQ